MSAQVCPLCKGTRYQSDPVRGTRRCPDCRPPKHSLVPARYAGTSIGTLVADSGRHAKQEDVIAYLNEHPGSSYYLCGENDTGKTHFMWALYEHAISSGRKAFFFTAVQWVEECIARGDFETPPTSYFILGELQNTQHCSVFIDDLDKKKVTEFVSDCIFQLVDVVYNQKHQIVVTSQLDPERRVHGRLSLIEHFDNYDGATGRYGVGIVRRIVNEDTAVFRLF